MHLYDARVGQFIPHATAGTIAGLLKARFASRLDYNPSESEVTSWEKSLGAFAETISTAHMADSWLVLEYQLPLASSRIDCMLIGGESSGKPNAVLLEFKQWDAVTTTQVPEIVNVGGNEHLHPSAQVKYYRQYLQDAHSAFVNEGIGLHSASYLHNVRQARNSGFFEPVYRELLADSPAFTMETVDDFRTYVKHRVGTGPADETVASILRDRYQPSKQLLDYVADSIDRYEPWRLLDEQRIVFNQIFAAVEQARKTRERTVIIVKGGPGTGKSVIALQVVGKAAREGYGVVHATGSKAFTTNLRGIVGRDQLFRFFMNLASVPKGSVELLVCDEAHRLRRQATMYARASDPPQAHVLIDSAQVSVFLLDEKQSVRADEIGSVWALQDYAQSQGIRTQVFDLNTQFRCAGSESYIRWVDYVFGLSDDPSYAWKRNEDYEVRLFDDVAEMELALKQRMDNGKSARIVAGFCWDWSDPNRDGSLVPDVKIGDWERPWNRKAVGSVSNAKHPYKIWATQTIGFSEIGCIYSAQGFEFDYVGVIVGPDFRWSLQQHRWYTDLAASKDKFGKSGLTKNPELANEKLANIYRVLSTRGMKGTYFYFLDPTSREHFRELLASADASRS